jgi:hypothetical protein
VDQRFQNNDILVLKNRRHTANHPESDPDCSPDAFFTPLQVEDLKERIRRKAAWRRASHSVSLYQNASALARAGYYPGKPPRAPLVQRVKNRLRGLKRLLRRLVTWMGRAGRLRHSRDGEAGCHSGKQEE